MAIIAVLVAIAIPAFNSQLEKSRDAVSVSNIRAAYAEAQTAYLTGSNTENATYVAQPTTTTGEGTPATTPATVTVEKVAIKSQKADNWSGAAAELPFYELMGTTAGTPDSANHADAAQNLDVDVVFAYDSNGKITNVTVSTTASV